MIHFAYHESQHLVLWLMHVLPVLWDQVLAMALRNSCKVVLLLEMANRLGSAECGCPFTLCSKINMNTANFKIY